ncbi:MAG TPA: HEAT repeat domain-containing protein [bacterium]|nr:HEAT repeat domain-containing protein [bacterium]HPO07204.1 HEAT repeat domain-containing protein [bacterium]HQO33477.1 HEAT repeat domain-containing protein [bacterium]HQP97310.1 HEAT repeat domain-containing protein [bacterium]
MKSLPDAIPFGWRVALVAILAISCTMTDEKKSWKKSHGDCKHPLLNEIDMEKFSAEEKEAFDAIDEMFAWYLARSQEGQPPASREVFPRMEKILGYGFAAIDPLQEIVRMGNRHSMDQIWELKETSYYMMAAMMLGRLGAGEAVGDLLTMADRRGPRESALRAAAIKALGEIGDPKALEMIREATLDHYEEVRKAAEEALGRMGETPSDATRAKE